MARSGLRGRGVCERQAVSNSIQSLRSSLAIRDPHDRASMLPLGRSARQGDAASRVGRLHKCRAVPRLRTGRTDLVGLADLRFREAIAVVTSPPLADRPP